MLILEKLKLVRYKSNVIPCLNFLIIMDVQYHLSFYIRYIELRHLHLKKDTYSILEYNNDYIF